MAVSLWYPTHYFWLWETQRAGDFFFSQQKVTWDDTLNNGLGSWIYISERRAILEFRWDTENTQAWPGDRCLTHNRDAAHCETKLSFLPWRKKEQRVGDMWWCLGVQKKKERSLGEMRWCLGKKSRWCEIVLWVPWQWYEMVPGHSNKSLVRCDGVLERRVGGSRWCFRKKSRWCEIVLWVYWQSYKIVPWSKEGVMWDGAWAEIWDGALAFEERKKEE